MINAGVRISDRHPQHARDGDCAFAPPPRTTSASHRSGPGVLAYSHRGKLLHMNRRAFDMIGHPDQAEAGPPTMMLSNLVRELRIQIEDTLYSRMKADVWETFELRRVMSEFGREIMLHGFGLPDRNSSECARVFIIFEEVNQ